jgi:hypothetical protein
MADIVNPLVISDENGGIAGFNCFTADKIQFYTLIDDSLASRFDAVPMISVLSLEEDLNTQRNLPTFWTQRVVDSETLNTFKVNLPPLENEEAVRVAVFFEHWARKPGMTTQEVGTFILLDTEANRLFFIVPQQKVTGASVDWKNLSTVSAISFDGTVKTVPEWLQQYTFVGYCHSHNTMRLSTPSSVDDAQEVDGKPFGVHILLSTFSWDDNGQVSFVVTVTAAHNNERHTLEMETVYPSISVADMNAMRDSWDLTEINKYVETFTFRGGYQYGKNWWQRKGAYYSTQPKTAYSGGYTYPDYSARLKPGTTPTPQYRHPYAWGLDDYDVEFGDPFEVQDNPLLTGTVSNPVDAPGTESLEDQIVEVLINTEPSRDELMAILDRFFDPVTGQVDQNKLFAHIDHSNDFLIDETDDLGDVTGTYPTFMEDLVEVTNNGLSDI